MCKMFLVRLWHGGKVLGVCQSGFESREVLI